MKGLLLYGLLVRCLAVLLSFAGILFGYFIEPVAWQERSLAPMAHHVISGERYDTKMLADALNHANLIISDSCITTGLRSVAFIRLRLVEDAIGEADRRSLDDRLDAFKAAALRSLSCAPADPFLWFALYWVEVTQRGFAPELLVYLQKSYQLGPFEGWIQVKRNRFALAVYDKLPEDLARQVVLEFKTLVNSGFTADAASILVGPGWNIRSKLLAPLDDVKMRYRRELFKEVRRAGYEVAIPGVDTEVRPWN
ncbi:MAG: hypothetical protein EKK33_33770 [Bradyrhizobiaceae bacterium]|jgi:hypothetical protein|nr:MAG: hypothetical protein EKK33_33770 [Bradyrhizobiaceae bacterium]